MDILTTAGMKAFAIFENDGPFGTSAAGESAVPSDHRREGCSADEAHEL
ncbi:MAG: hypothetical protein V3U45_00490 [bacterium]